MVGFLGDGRWTSSILAAWRVETCQIGMVRHACAGGQRNVCPWEVGMFELVFILCSSTAIATGLLRIKTSASHELPCPTITCT